MFPKRFCLYRYAGAPWHYGEQGKLSFLLMGTWEHEQIFKGTWEQSGFWGAFWNFFYGNSQKAFLGIREILETF